MKNRVTPDFITKLEYDEIFVFGSNESGIHGAGAAKTALKWGAEFGQAEGLQGRTYAIPTVNKKVTGTLTINEIKLYVDRFIEVAKKMPLLNFLVTEIGCGLAGLTPEEIAPLFKETIDIENIYLPIKFWKIIKN